MNKPELREAIAARLRVERARLNLTQSKVHDLTGIAPNTLSRYEQADQLLSIEALYRLAKAYGIDPASLLPPLTDIADLPKSPKQKK